MFIGIYNIPNTISLLGLTFSILACFFSFSGFLQYAIVSLMFSGICDMLDGMVARKTSLNEDARNFGIQLDSIVDIVSFGVAPVIIALNVMSFSSFIDYLILVIYISSAAIRLAYFNTFSANQTGKKKYYTGLPVTFAAMIFPFSYMSGWINNDFLYLNVIRLTFIALTILFLLKVSIPKPSGIFYIGAPIVVFILTFFWLRV